MYVHRHVRHPAVAVLALALAATLVQPAAPAQASRRIFWGAYVNPAARWVSQTQAREDVTSLERKIGRKLGIDHRFYGWRESWPTSLERWDVRNRRFPMVTWEPHNVSLKRIINGRYDKLIRTRARVVRDFGHRIFVRWAHEMNGDWYSWGNKPGNFVKAWRRIVRLFREVGARNAVWVWGPNSESIPKGYANRPSRYYPGNYWVNWIGVSGFNWGNSRDWSKWRTFREIFRNFYRRFSSKPIMIVESASVEGGGNKPTWIRDARRIIKRWRRISGFVWFHVGQWRADTSPGSMRAIRGMA
ncbi:MAG: hypothetical protein M3245_00350, partial [Actinomycetota bacterium]|nr:hypothetical protein [Actinomycetota bacterium]